MLPAPSSTALPKPNMKPTTPVLIDEPVQSVSGEVNSDSGDLTTVSGEVSNNSAPVSDIEEHTQNQATSQEEAPVPAVNSHPMTTRAKAGIQKPNTRYALIASKFSTNEPKNIASAMQHPGCDQAVLDKLLTALNTRFSMKDLGKPHYFLGIEIESTSDGLFLHQTAYASDILHQAGMTNCNPMPTPLPQHLENLNSEPFSEPTYFRSLAGKLQYLTITRPDIQYAVNFICQRMHAPTTSDFGLLKRILRYVKGTLHLGLPIKRNSSLLLSAFCDSDYAGCKDTRRSTTGFSSFQLADVFTKPLPRRSFIDLRRKLGVSESSTPSLRGSVNNNKTLLVDQKEVKKDLAHTSPNAPLKPSPPTENRTKAENQRDLHVRRRRRSPSTTNSSRCNLYPVTHL
ncbi:unnamed protein product [Arabidopsis halleri]